MKQVKVVVIGAASASFGRGALADLIVSKELTGETELTISLVDLDEVGLGRMYHFAQRLCEHYATSVRLEATTDRREALPGADYVITAVSQRRMELWAEDFFVPAAYGFRQVFGECGGPGGAFHALRSMHLIVPMCRDMEKLCPDALLLNFTNPESRVTLAATQLTRIRAVGLCHGVFSTLSTVARVLGRPEPELELSVGGLNHFHWVLGLREAATGGDLLPLFNQRMAEGDWGLPPLTQRMYEAFGLLPFPSDNHIGEYVSFAYDVIGPDWVGFRHDYARLLRMEEFKRVADGEAPLTDELAAPSGELAVPIICDIEFDRHQRRLAVNVPNAGGAVSNLPEEAVVEVPAWVDAGGIHPLAVGALPEAIAAMCNLQVSIQKLLVEAYRERSKQQLLQALLLDPVVDSLPRAERMREELLRVDADFLPVFE